MAIIATTRFGHTTGQPIEGASNRGSPPSLARSSTPAADRLVALVKELKAPYLHERSIKLVDSAVLDHRFLVSFSPRALGKHPVSTLSLICTRLQMPMMYLPAIEANFPDAGFVHLGFEQGVDSYLYKTYLEFPTESMRVVDSLSERSNPSLKHLAFKWRPGETTAHTIARYLSELSFSPDGMAHRLEEIYGGRALITCSVAEEIVRLSANRMPPEDIVFLEVQEEKNPRRSFDICVYDAELKLADVENMLAQLWGHFGLPGSAFRQMFEPLKNESLGHVSGGVGRNGEEFFTVYFGARRH